MKNNTKQSGFSSPLKHKNFYSYFVSRLKETPAGMRIQKTAKHFKKYILITKFLRYTWNILMFIQTSAFYIIYATILIVLIPVILMILAVLFLFSLFRYKKYNKFFEKKFLSSTCRVYFWNGNDVSLKYLISNIKAHPKENEITIIAYSGSFGHPLLAVNEETESVYHISMGYFYSLKKHVLDKNHENIIYIN